MRDRSSQELGCRGLRLFNGVFIVLSRRRARTPSSNFHLTIIADVKTLDQPVSHLEDVCHQSVGPEIAIEVTHYLMNFDYHFPLTVGQDFYGLDMGIDDRPLALPIAAHLIPSVDVAPFHSICPDDFGMHGRENALDVSTIEEGIDSP